LACSNGSEDTPQPGVVVTPAVQGDAAATSAHPVSDGGGSVTLPFDASAVRDAGMLGAGDADSSPVANEAGAVTPDAAPPSSDAGDAGPSVDTDAGNTPDSGPMAIQGCGTSTLLPLPSEPTQRGPWPVGQKTVKIGRLSSVEVFYPAVVGSEQGKTEATFDARTFLPTAERNKIPQAEATILHASTYLDLPFDDKHGPYPVVVFVHGTASFRLGSFHSQALWASRGFVVIAADHPGLYLADYLGTNGCGLSAPAENLSADMDAEIAALRAPSGDLAFLSGHIDAQRIALAGHSAGAVAVAKASTKPGVQVVMALAGTSAVSTSGTLKSVVFVAGIDDNVLAYAAGGFKLGNLLYPGSDSAAYKSSPGPTAVKKRLVGMTKGGHLNVTDLCFKNALNKSDLDVAMAHNVCGVSSVTSLADCGSMDPKKGLEITNAVTTSVLEETLQCQDRKATISGLKQRYPEIGDFQEAL
jgi:hypothetical protein